MHVICNDVVFYFVLKTGNQTGVSLEKAIKKMEENKSVSQVGNKLEGSRSDLRLPEGYMRLQQAQTVSTS